jgi:hypothetical protein
MGRVTVNFDHFGGYMVFLSEDGDRGLALQNLSTQGMFGLIANKEDRIPRIFDIIFEMV